MTINAKVAANRKPLYGMFTDIPPHYDLINRLFTWGMDKGWRKKAAQACITSHPSRMLDLCCGTGDLAVTVAKMADYPIEIKGLDFSQPMLDIAAHKAGALEGKKISFYQGDASKLPFESDYFDCIGISFAFRNLTYKNPLAKEHVSEIFRVLKPGGRCVIAESSQPNSGFIRAIDHFYVRQYVARIGSLISGNKAAYHYLAESSTHYFSQPEMRDYLIQHGFSEVTCRPLFFGASAIYIAVK